MVDKRDWYIFNMVTDCRTGKAYTFVAHRAGWQLREDIPDEAYQAAWTRGKNLADDAIAALQRRANRIDAFEERDPLFAAHWMTTGKEPM